MLRDSAQQDRSRKPHGRPTTDVAEPGMREADDPFDQVALGLRVRMTQDLH
jgi:hypothetical protein